MELPWKNQELKDRVEELETSLEEKQEKLQKLQDMLEAEKDRRSDLAREKQEAEEKINRLNDKLEGLKSNQAEEETPQNLEFDDIGLNIFREALEKLKGIKSSKKDLVTVFSPGKLSGHSEISGIRNSLPEEKLNPLLDQENLIVFYTESLGLFCFKSKPFFNERFEVDKQFKIEELLDLIEKKKYWALISRGESKIFSEKSGKFEEVERITDRVNRQHGKGGFSQGRFERKRDEQVEQHLENVEEELQELEGLYLLGDEALCQDLPGEYLGGFDPNSSPVENFYSPRRLKNSTLPD